MPELDTAAPPKAGPKFKLIAGYIVVSADWNPARAPWNAWNLLTLRGARAALRYWKLWNPDTDKAIVRVETTYTVIEGGGDA